MSTGQEWVRCPALGRRGWVRRCPRKRRAPWLTPPATHLGGPPDGPGCPWRAAGAVVLTRAAREYLPEP
ncbi:hypothetical protein ACH5AO_15895 [Streptomyces sp. NPDC018964]|uniref:hypothetical protein n=1 Tax=unclassified Streptomyces TaxID=2593676 RepID=UPI0037A9264E